MNHRMHIPFLSNEDNEYLNFDQICERITDEETAQNLYSYILEQGNRLNPNEADYLALVLFHTGYKDLFQKAEHQFSQIKWSGNQTSSSIFPAHLGLFYLQEAMDPNNSAAEEFWNKGHDQFKEASSIDPSSPIVLLLQCFLFLMKNSPEDSDRALVGATFGHRHLKSQEQTFLFPLEPLITFGYALSLYQKDQYEEAFKYFGKFFRKFSQAIPMVRLAMGETLLALSKIEEAKYAFLKVLSMEPDNIDALTALATINFNEGTSQSLEETKNYLQKALQVNSNYSPTLLLQADLAFNSESLQSHTSKYAKKAYHNAKTDKLRADAIFILAQYFHYKGDYEKAKSHYELVVQKCPTHPKANFYLGLFASKDEPMKAIDYIEKEGVHSKLYEVFEANSVLGLCYCRLLDRNDILSNEKNFKQAVKYLKLASNQQTNDIIGKIKVLSTLGWLRIKSLKFNKAEATYDRAVEEYQKLTEDQIGSDDASDLIPYDQLLMFLGISQFQNGKPKVALNTFNQSKEEFLKNDPDGKLSPILLYNMALCKEEMNKFSEAKKEYTKLHEDFPSFPEPLLRIAALAVRDTRPNIINHEAKKALETIITEINPDNIQAQIELANVIARSKDLNESRKIMQTIQEKAGSSQNDSDGFLYSTISIGNYFLESAQNKNDEKEKLERCKKAQAQYLKALKKNHFCVAAANGLAICWLIAGHVDEAKNFLQLVRENRSEQASSYVNLGLADMQEGKYQQAMILFDTANKKFYEKTDINLLLQYYYASKNERKWESCLEIAETLCQLRPETQIHWYLLATSLQKVVITQYKTRQNEGKPLLVQQIDRWVKQLKKCKSLFETFTTTAFGSQNSEQLTAKIQGADSQIKSLSDKRQKAIQAEQQRRQQLEQQARSFSQQIEDNPRDLDD